MSKLSPVIQSISPAQQSSPQFCLVIRYELGACRQDSKTGEHASLSKDSAECFALCVGM